MSLIVAVKVQDKAKMELALDMVSKHAFLYLWMPEGVFQHPEDIGITIEYLNRSFLVTKPSGGSRLVTAFADVARYSKPQPSLMPDLETTLRTIARWKSLIVTDQTNALYQKERESMRRP